ncbi:uncharacterized protein HRG_11591 [Hirsutella rhossiliensis]|uniref:FAM192A/Fyv6 N-terminal domain-containing protein n=1 Tax=Hirsutella rhossiliensis TaxID=111463 RepID=A0A9P8MLX5_9HYPO|nr:uncharacterized protein HRG_11591 [Hirsutella rhossiliensis]KAH0957444.1 hypothetical protein HRG_11591 [Hirsutella rhossiliensis]
MTSRFVSGGTIAAAAAAASGAKKNPEWEAVQQELEAERKRREEARLKAATGGEQSLYDILQANKAAKQAAFEEKNKLKNQFRALDDDEAGFLDEVRERMRRDEERVRRETEEGLRAFRQRQRGGDEEGEGGDGRPPLQRAGTEGVEVDEEAGEWGVGRKRKRSARERDIRGLRRRVSAGGDEGPGERTRGGPAEGGSPPAGNGPVKGGGTAGERAKEKKALSALVDYGSDESD